MAILNGVSQFMHGADYNPEQWAGCEKIITEDFRLMKLCRVNALSIGIFSWAELEPEEGVFRFGWLDDIIARCEAQKLNVLLATPSAARPVWLHKLAPETARVSRAGAREAWGRRANHCWSSPVMREKLAVIIDRLAARYAGSSALAGWHIGNEHSGHCYCPLCRAGFAAWLERRYRTLERLNGCYWSAYWGHRYGAWEDVNPCDDSVDLAGVDYHRYQTELTADFLQFEIDRVRRWSDRPVTTNMMGLYPGLDYWKIAPKCDWVSDDSYPTWYCGELVNRSAELSMIHDMHYAMKDRPFLIMECCPGVPNYKQYSKMRRPGEFEREMLLALGHGADGTMYFQWRKSRGNCEKIHGAVVGHDGGTETRVFRQVAKYGEKLERMAEIAGSTKQAEAAVIFDWESNWALTSTLGFGARWGEPGALRLEPTIGAHYRAVWKQNIAMDVISGECDFSRYRLLLMPMLFMVKPGMIQRLKDFVEAGGTVVATYLSFCVDQHNLCFEGGNPGGAELRKLFGVWSEDIDIFDPPTLQSLSYAGQSYPVERRCEYCHAEGAEVLAVYEHEFFAGTPALTRRRFGKGCFYYLAADTGDDFLEAFYRDVTDSCALSGCWTDVPNGVHVSKRSGNGRDYFFLINTNSCPVELSLPAPMDDLWNSTNAVTLLCLDAGEGSVLRK